MLFTSCNKDDNGDYNNPTDDDIETLNQGSNIQRNFLGKIIDESGDPIDDATVTIGSETATTDTNGVFIINDADVKEKQAYIIAEKTGYLKGMKTTIPTEGTNIVQIVLVEEQVIATVASGSDSEVNLPNGTTVKFDGEFKDENGNAYSGNVDVIMYHLDPSNPLIDDIMPGNLQAQNEDGDERVLESYGMLNVELRGDSGEALNIADGHFAEIELTVDPAQNGVAPSTIPLWHFDEDNGYWVEEGEATLVGGKYVAQVSHFSWWNCDAQFPTVTLCLNVVDNSSNPLSNVKVELWRAGAVYPRTGYSDANGEICGLIPANETLTLKAYDQCGVEVFTTSIGPFSTDTDYGNIVMPSISASVITGNLVDCNMNNVTNGYVALTYGNEYATVNVTNGSFSFSVIECASLTTFTLEGVDYDAFQTTTVIPFDFSNTNLGNLIACNAVAEYISIQIDSDPVEYYLNNVGGSVNGDSITVSALSSNDEDGFYAGGGSTTLGTYSFTSTPSFWIESRILNLDYQIPNTIEFTLTNIGAVGDYIDMTISGDYTDLDGNIRTVSGTVHVIRDN